jgi:hypothetical protein
MSLETNNAFISIDIPARSVIFLEFAMQILYHISPAIPYSL